MRGEGGRQSQYLERILMGAGRKVGSRPATTCVGRRDCAYAEAGDLREEPWERTPLSTSRRGAGQHLQAAWDFQGNQRG